jgi:hypothetical protein
LASTRPVGASQTGKIDKPERLRTLELWIDANKGHSSQRDAISPAIHPLRPAANLGYLELKTIETFPHKSRLKHYGTAFQGTTLVYLGEMHELRSTITQVIALGEQAALGAQVAFV